MMNRMLLSLFACVFFACSAAAAPKPIYTLVLNTEAPASEPTVPQTVCIYVNDNPTGLHVNSTSMGIQLNQYLKKGANEIRIVDSAKRTWSVQVGLSEEGKDPELVLEKDVSAQGKGEAVVTIDLPKVDWALPIFDKALSDQDVQPGPIAQHLERINAAVKGPDKAAAVSLIWSHGTGVWAKEAYGQEADMLDKMKQMTQQFFEGIDKIEETPMLTDLKIVRGKNVVLVYRGITKQESGMTPYLLRWKNKDGSDGLAPQTTLYLTKDGWAVWQ